jgi:hypothetical protein
MFRAVWKLVLGIAGIAITVWYLLGDWCCLYFLDDPWMLFVLFSVFLLLTLLGMTEELEYRMRRSTHLPGKQSALQKRKSALTICPSDKKSEPSDSAKEDRSSYS